MRIPRLRVMYMHKKIYYITIYKFIIYISMQRSIVKDFIDRRRDENFQMFEILDAEYF